MLNSGWLLILNCVVGVVVVLSMVAFLGVVAVLLLLYSVEELR